MTKQTYVVQSPVKFDGKDYGIGDSIDLEDKDAKDLLAINALGDAVGTASNTLTAPVDHNERITAIVAAIGQLDKADTALWTNAGAPKTEGLTAITGWPVAAKERDVAWAQINTPQ